MEKQNNFGFKWLTCSTICEIGPVLSKKTEAIILEEQATMLSLRAIVPRQFMSPKTAFFFTFHLIRSDFVSNQVSIKEKLQEKVSGNVSHSWKEESWLCWTIEGVAKR